MGGEREKTTDLGNAGPEAVDPPQPPDHPGPIGAPSAAEPSVVRDLAALLATPAPISVPPAPVAVQQPAGQARRAMLLQLSSTGLTAASHRPTPPRKLEPVASSPDPLAPPVQLVPPALPPPLTAGAAAQAFLHAPWREADGAPGSGLPPGRGMAPDRPQRMAPDAEARPSASPATAAHLLPPPTAEQLQPAAAEPPRGHPVHSYPAPLEGGASDAIPSTLRKPMRHERKSGNATQFRAAGIGLVSGFIVVIPALLWFTGVFDRTPPSASQAARSQVTARSPADEPSPPIKRAGESTRAAASEAPVGSVVAALPAPPQARPQGPEPVLPRPASAAPPKAPQQALDAAGIQQMRDKASHSIAQKDISAARHYLERAVQAGDPLSAYYLAMTYDPHELVTWGAHGVKPDPAKAIMYYEKALEGGYTQALSRLQALK